MGTCSYCLKSNLSRLYKTELRRFRSELRRGRCTCSIQERAPIRSRNRRTNHAPVINMRSRRTSDRIGNRSRLPPANLNSNSADEQHDCVVCQDAETDPDKQRLPCGHSFHRLCVTTWLELTNSCPVCRQKFGITNDQMDFSQLIQNITFRLGVVTSLVKRTQEVTSLVMENIEKQLDELSRNLQSQ